MAADTSSAPAANTPAVGYAAAALAALSVEPIFAKSDAAALTHSGAAKTKDIFFSSTSSRQPDVAQRNARPQRVDEIACLFGLFAGQGVTGLDPETIACKAFVLRL
jgi:hypothetical protein